MSVSIIEPAAAAAGLSLGPIGAIGGSLLGKIGDSLFGKSQAEKNRESQEEFAKKGIRWRVADAKAAGLHPLAALGASGASFTPSNVVSDFGGIGQDIHRAVEATRTSEERAQARTAQEAALALQTRVGTAQANMYDAQAALANAQAHKLTFVGPPMPSEAELSSGGNNLGGVRTDTPDRSPPGLWQVKPAEVQSGARGEPGLLAGPPNPSERIIDFRGQKIRIPNVDLDSLMEEPLASVAILAALNPGLSRQLLDEFLKRTGIVQPWKRTPAPSLRRGGGASGSW